MTNAGRGQAGHTCERVAEARVRARIAAAARVARVRRRKACK